MALQTSGAISFANLQSEFGGSHPITMGEYAQYRVSGSGNTISMNQFYGATAVTPFAWTTSSPAALNSQSFSMNVTSETGGLVKVATRLNMTFNASSIGMTIDDVRFAGSFGGSTGLSNGMSQGNVNYSNTDDIASIQTRWVLNNIYVDFRDANYDEQILAYYLVGSGSETYQTVRLGPSGDSAAFDFTGVWITVTPTRFGGSQSNSQSHMLQLQADSNSSSQVAKTVIKGGSGGYIEFQVRVNKSSGGSSTFSYRRTYTTTGQSDTVNTGSYFADD